MAKIVEISLIKMTSENWVSEPHLNCQVYRKVDPGAHGVQISDSSK